jgi:hypothetical protein
MEDEANTRLGTLLEKAGIVTSGDIAEAVAVSKRLQTPIGRVLIMSGCVTERTLTAALEAQTMLRDRQLNLEAAIEALVRVAQEKINLQDALKKTDKVPQAGASTNRLGEILIQFGLINKATLSEALRTSAETGMPLGSSLVCLGAISPSLLPLLLRTQDQIRDGSITIEQAVQEFREAYAMWNKAKESIKRGANDSGLQGGAAPSSVEAPPIVANNYQDYYRKLAAQSNPPNQAKSKQRPPGYQSTPPQFANYQPKGNKPQGVSPEHFSTNMPAVTPPAATQHTSQTSAPQPHLQSSPHTVPPKGSGPSAATQSPPHNAQDLRAFLWPSSDKTSQAQPQIPVSPAPTASGLPPAGGKSEPAPVQQDSIIIDNQRTPFPVRHTDVAMPTFERMAAKQQFSGSAYSPASTSFDMPASPVADTPTTSDTAPPTPTAPQPSGQPAVLKWGSPAPLPASGAKPLGDEPPRTSSMPEDSSTSPGGFSDPHTTAHVLAQQRPPTGVNAAPSGKTPGPSLDHPAIPTGESSQHMVKNLPLPPAVLAAISAATRNASVEPLEMPELPDSPREVAEQLKVSETTPDQPTPIQPQPSQSVEAAALTSEQALNEQPSTIVGSSPLPENGSDSSVVLLDSGSDSAKTTVTLESPSQEATDQLPAPPEAEIAPDQSPPSVLLTQDIPRPSLEILTGSGSSSISEQQAFFDKIYKSIEPAASSDISAPPIESSASSSAKNLVQSDSPSAAVQSPEDKDGTPLINPFDRPDPILEAVQSLDVVDATPLAKSLDRSDSLATPVQSPDDTHVIPLVKPLNQSDSTSAAVQSPDDTHVIPLVKPLDQSDSTSAAVQSPDDKDAIPLAEPLDQSDSASAAVQSPDDTHVIPLVKPLDQSDLPSAAEVLDQSGLPFADAQQPEDKDATPLAEPPHHSSSPTAAVQLPESEQVPPLAESLDRAGSPDAPLPEPATTSSDQSGPADALPQLPDLDAPPSAAALDHLGSPDMCSYLPDLQDMSPFASTVNHDSLPLTEFEDTSDKVEPAQALPETTDTSSTSSVSASLPELVDVADIDSSVDLSVAPVTEAEQVDGRNEDLDRSLEDEGKIAESVGSVVGEIKRDGKKRKKSAKAKTFTNLKQPENGEAEHAANIISLVEILKLGGCFTQKELLAAFNEGLENPTKAVELLFAIGVVDEKLINGAKICQTMVQEGHLKPQQAAYVLSSLRSGRLTLETALEEVGATALAPNR